MKKFNLKPSRKDQELASEYEIRRELYREIYGEEDISEQREREQDYGLENQQEGTALEIGL